MQHYSNADWALILITISAVFITLAWIFLKPLPRELNPKEREKQKMIKDLSVLLRQVGRTLNFYRATKSKKLQESYERIALQQFYLAHTIQYLKNQAHGIYRYPSYQEIIEDYPAGIEPLEKYHSNKDGYYEAKKDSNPIMTNFGLTKKDDKRYYPNVDDERNPIFEKDNLDPAIDWSQEREIERTLEKNNSQSIDNEEQNKIEIPGKFPNGRDCIIRQEKKKAPERVSDPTIIYQSGKTEYLNDNSEQRPSSAIPKFPEDRIG